MRHLRRYLRALAATSRAYAGAASCNLTTAQHKRYSGLLEYLHDAMVFLPLALVECGVKCRSMPNFVDPGSCSCLRPDIQAPGPPSDWLLLVSTSIGANMRSINPDDPCCKSGHRVRSSAARSGVTGHSIAGRAERPVVEVVLGQVDRAFLTTAAMMFLAR